MSIVAKSGFLKKLLLLVVSISFLVFAITFFVLSSEQEDVAVIYSYNEVSEIFDSLDDKALCIFDVDDTLLYSKDPIFQNSWSESWSMKLLWNSLLPSYLFQFFDQHYINRLISIIFNSIELEVIELSIVKKIKLLQARGVWCIALTSMEQGAFGVIPSMEEWRFEHLKQLGYEFNFDSTKPIFELKDEMFDKRVPLFYRGILCANHHRKGHVLKKYLETLGSRPSQVIFFDDIAKEVISVQKAMDEYGVPCQAFVYRGGYKRHASSFDFWGMRKRIVHLIERGEWLVK